MGTYEPCVLGSDGNCTRWSHDHAADRPSVTDNARADTPDGPPPGEVRTDRDVEFFFVAGMATAGTRPHVAREEFRRWLAADRAETTTATDEDVTRVLAEHTQLPRDDGGAECECGGWRGPWSGQEHERHVAQALADADLLATARTRPTREQIAQVLYVHDNGATLYGAPMTYMDEPGRADDYLAAAGAVLALLNEEADR